MSLSEYQRFVADLSSNTVLCAEAGKAAAEQAATALHGIVSFAAGKGYRFSVEEVAKFVTAAKQLTDAELAGVAGGAAADEVSAAIAGLFGSQAQQYQAAGAQAAVFHQQFVQLLSGGGAAYAARESGSVT